MVVFLLILIVVILLFGAGAAMTFLGWIAGAIVFVLGAGLCIHWFGSYVSFDQVFAAFMILLVVLMLFGLWEQGKQKL